MFAQIEYPEKILPADLDEYLANGWFRMRQTIFTTNFLQFNEQFYAAIWLRVSLGNLIPDKKYIALQKINRGFTTEIKKTPTGTISNAHELLYLQYRQYISFDVSPSLQELLLGTDAISRFNTYEVNIYDNNTLIAAGFFDLGENSAEGISCIYHPDYKKHSLGKYLMYLKMDYCKQRNLRYFYPGYVVPGYPAFDYKLQVAKASIEYLQLSSQQWVAFSTSNGLANPLLTMIELLYVLQEQLTQIGVTSRFLRYRFFEANLHPHYYGYNFFDFPVFVHCLSRDEANSYLLLV